MTKDKTKAPAEQNADNADATSHDTVDTNAGPDAVMGTVSESGPTDAGDQKPMDQFD